MAAAEGFASMAAGHRHVSVHYLRDAAATLAFGRELAGWLTAPDSCGHDAIVHLRGELGAGKTTVVRGILRALGFSGPVKSPTYTLLEAYEELRVFHFDLYRIADSQELDFIGMDELLASRALKLIEWPERGAAHLPPADVEIQLRVAGPGRYVEVRS